MNIRLSLLFALLVTMFGGTLHVQAQEALDPAPSTPYGVFVQQALDYSDGTTSVSPDSTGSQIEAAQLGAAFVRASNKIWLWDIAPNYTLNNGVIDAVYTANQGTSDPTKKIGVVWSIVNQMNPNGSGTHFFDGSPNMTSTAFVSALNSMLNVYHPSVVQIENEELVSQFYQSSSVASDYLAELAIAIPAVHSHTASDGNPVKVTDGAFQNKAAVLLTYGNLYATKGSATADAYADKVFNPAYLELQTIGGNLVIHDIWLDSLTTGEPNKPSGLTATQSSTYDTEVGFLQQGTLLINAYANLALDYVNFHWYNARPGVTPADDSSALASTIQYLHSATGKTIISTEIGNYAQDTTTTGDVSALLNRFSTYNTGHPTAPVPIVIWYDADGNPAVSLHWADKNYKTDGLNDGGIHLVDLHPGGTTFQSKTAACKLKTHPAICTN